MSRFAGTASYYARFRSRYPPELFALLVKRFGLDRRSRVLDLATGTGQLALPLAETVGEVVALDVDPDMLAELDAVRPANVRVVHGRAEEIGSELGRFDLTTIGRAFHWMERDEVLARVHAISDGLMIGGDGTSPGEPWETRAAVAAEFVGDRRPRRSDESWSEVIARSPFRTSEEHEFVVERTWSLDEVVGQTFSLSWASPAILGDRMAAFEQELRARLGPGPWVERAVFEVLLAPAA